ACRVRVKDMAPRGFRLLNPSSMSEAVTVNRAYIERLAAEARSFIAGEAGGGKVFVAVSGGIDSSVVLSLAVEALGSERVVAVYADTGMEFPASLETAERLADKLGVELLIARSSVDPFREIRSRGLMTVENRWCTRILKLAPLARLYKRMGARIVADGARALESEGRAATPRTGVNPLIPFVKRILPIHSWSRLEVQLYAHLKGLPVNPLYDMGLTRIGCIYCPAMHPHEVMISRGLHPQFYRGLENVIGRRLKV
ncbi:MAG: phosphoadenosine phosphosulfate reductase family protein, partial [Desulfurococcales archaeon]|nr:phosphoadenosine phosphosulfate reductase family protein [Desulfurococcales archaeon]